MKKKSKNSLKFQNDYKILSSKNGGKVLIISNGECITVDALKLLRLVLISLSIKNKNDNQKEAA